ncbi:hypothetical protein SynBIOSU31_00720 [Synechococcus sp. BIOS-U3-1]|nr:hypothetical protein SynBIOSU31_00720 [Synechococcus sp. BIOS-U3-1]
MAVWQRPWLDTLAGLFGYMISSILQMKDFELVRSLRCDIGLKQRAVLVDHRMP